MLGGVRSSVSTILDASPSSLAGAFDTSRDQGVVGFRDSEGRCRSGSLLNDDRVHDGLRRLILVRPQVTVHVQRGPGGPVPRPRLDSLHIGPVGDEQAREVVPQVV